MFKYEHKVKFKIHLKMLQSDRHYHFTIETLIQMEATILQAWLLITAVQDLTACLGSAYTQL